MRIAWAFSLAMPILLAVNSNAVTQAIPKPDYVTYLSREPLLPVQASAGNKRFHLFGDSTAVGYQDEAPRDGIDDDREHALRMLAMRFAPWMVRNSIDL